MRISKLSQKDLLSDIFVYVTGDYWVKSLKFQPLLLTHYITSLNKLNTFFLVKILRYLSFKWFFSVLNTNLHRSKARGAYLQIGNLNKFTQTCKYDFMFKLYKNREALKVKIKLNSGPLPCEYRHILFKNIFWRNLITN